MILKPNLGQVWTPPDIAEYMCRLVKPYLNESSSILDPCAGPGTFLVASNKEKLPFREFKSLEIDETLGSILLKIQTGNRHKFEIVDFLKLSRASISFDAVIMNPPYIRHENLTTAQKKWLENFKKLSNFPFTQRMNLYGYFMLHAIQFLRDEGIMCAIVYDSVDKTIYGKQLIEYMKHHGRLLLKEKVEAPFKNRMVDAEIILWKKTRSDSIIQPLELLFEYDLPTGYTFISELAKVQRGTSFLRREFFVYSDSAKEFDTQDFITKQNGTESLFAVPNCFALLENSDAKRNLELLQKVKSKFLDSKIGKLKKLPSPIKAKVIFNYYIRNNPRHLFNNLNLPASDNFYCIQPFDAQFNEAFWFLANSEQVNEQLFKNSRLQGSGLRKLQLFEYKSVPFPNYNLFCEEIKIELMNLSHVAVEQKMKREQVTKIASKFLSDLGY